MLTAAGSLHERYARALQDKQRPDPHQQAALDALERLRAELTLRAPHRERGWLRRLVGGSRATDAAIQGVYLWGGVGRGKTWLMDLFFDSLGPLPKHRAHFHRFMQSVHNGLKAHKNQVDPLATVAAEISAKARVVCLDELFVSDIADAMLLAGLFTHLIGHGTALVFTSNLPPSSLYRDGLQRQRFLPAINLLEKHCQLVCVDGPVDYRLRQLTRRPIYLPSTAADTPASLQRLFAELSDQSLPEPASLWVEGREIPCLAVAETMVWFDFKALCGGPRSQTDYVSLAREFQTVMLSDVPLLGSEDDNAARRFIALVDEFYDRRVNLIVSAAAEPTELYRGERLRFEFERTASRLIEMQSEAYLASEHRG